MTYYAECQPPAPALREKTGASSADRISKHSSSDQVGHHFMFSLLKGKGFPCGFISLVSQLYYRLCCFGMANGSEQLFWVVLCGVLQGWPLSGLLFAIAMEPFCAAFCKLKTAQNLTNEARLCIRACADDVGAVISSLAPQNQRHLHCCF